MDWTGVGSAAVGAISSALGASSAYSRQKKLLAKQNEYNVYNYQHRYQWAVDDLRQAGLNPILAANSAGAVAGSVSSSSTPAVATADTSDIGESGRNHSALKLQAKIAEKELAIKQTEADTNKMNAESNKINAESNMMLANSTKSLQDEQELDLSERRLMDKDKGDLEGALLKAQTKEVNQNIALAIVESAYRCALLKAQTGETVSRAEMNRITSEEMKKRGVREEQLKENTIRETQSLIDKTIADTKLTDEQRGVVERQNAKWDREHPLITGGPNGDGTIPVDQLHLIFAELLGEWLPTINPLVRFPSGGK